jgi:hypothetical protein
MCFFRGAFWVSLQIIMQIRHISRFSSKIGQHLVSKVRTMLKWQSHSQPVLAAESSPHCTQKNRVYDKFPQAFIK